jgi:hypothetical protein
VAVGKLASLSFKFLPTKEKGGRKYEPTQGSKAARQ